MEHADDLIADLAQALG
ncbi:MAG TPA: hypothetical protein PKC03_09735 [Dokdonella sp.]|nr:hypothetical protein [Dokdonella sp.]